ncbi:hypothetical protein QR98_0105300 [Sarcoptes scabiei]|uniref:Uncharacterized protein n=1 Tax=Sarcoptes scabiei TaxID=52283 RepID=A0A132ALW2_SARSC|nr:hypothetical protein QR98_0105300 [Sarcoptes scabiei]
MNPSKMRSQPFERIQIKPMSNQINWLKSIKTHWIHSNEDIRIRKRFVSVSTVSMILNFLPFLAEVVSERFYLLS